MFGNVMRKYHGYEIAEMLMHSNMLYQRLMGHEQEFEQDPEYVCPLCHSASPRNPA